MGLTDEERDAIVLYRIDKAKETLVEAEGNVKMKFWYTAANRYYYACFQAVSALLIKNGYETRTHYGVMSLFNLHFVRTNIFSKEENRVFSRLYELRQSGDYGDMIDIDETDILPIVELTKSFVAKIEKLVRQTNIPIKDKD